MWRTPSQRGHELFSVTECGDGCSALVFDQYRSRHPQPGCHGACLFIPDTYSPTYSYPLVVSLHDDEASEDRLWNWFPRISENNFLGLGLRGPFPSRIGMPGQYRWIGRRPDASQAVIRNSIQATTSEWNVHPDRIVLFGEGNGAIVALQQFLLAQSNPEDSSPRLSGVICLNLPPCWPRLLPPVQDLLEGRMLLLDPVQHVEALAALDGLAEAGIDVTLHDQPDQSISSAINYWMMAAISTVVY